VIRVTNSWPLVAVHPIHPRFDFDLSQCRVGRLQVKVRRPAGGRPCAGINGERTRAIMEGRMTVSQQAYLLTAELFVLSFAAIFAFWFADRLRRNFFGKP